VNVRTREFWLYQSRNVQKPFAVHNVVTYNRANSMPEAYRFDCYVYHDDIPGTHCDCSIRQQAYKTGDEYAYAVCNVLMRYGIDTDDQDVNELAKEWMNIIIQC
jgi:hypothetical protein